MTEEGCPAARLDAVTLRYGRVACLNDVALAVPAGCMVGLIGPDGRRQSSVLSLIAGARRIQTRRCPGLGRRHGQRPVPHPTMPARGLYAARSGPQILYPDLTVQENIAFFSRLFGQAGRNGPGARGTARCHRPCAVRGSPRQEIVRRHASEARLVLLADPRPRAADPGRATTGVDPCPAGSSWTLVDPDALAPSVDECRRGRPPTWRRPSGSTG